MVEPEVIVAEQIDEKAEQIASIKEQIELAEKTKAEKMDYIKAAAEARFDNLLHMWTSAKAFDCVAEAMRVYLGNDVEVYIADCREVIKKVHGTIKKMRSSFKRKINNPNAKWEKWLDGYCECGETWIDEVAGVRAVVTQSLILDACQNIWDIVRKIEEWDTAANEEIERMKAQLAELEAED